MSERYTPHDFRKASLAVFAAVEEAVAKELAAMLRQAATDAEALAAKDEEIARLTVMGMKIEVELSVERRGYQVR